MKEITYTLETPFEYANKGDLTQAAFITLAPPTSRNMNECAFLKQAFFRALPKTGQLDVDKADTSEETELTGEAVMTLITMSSDVELSGVLGMAKELFTSGVAQVDGEAKLTKPLADLLSLDDLSAMTGEYLANFILASALRKMKSS